jgi:hypothetical protein
MQTQDVAGRYQIPDEVWCLGAVCETEREKCRRYGSQSRPENSAHHIANLSIDRTDALPKKLNPLEIHMYGKGVNQALLLPWARPSKERLVSVLLSGLEGLESPIARSRDLNELKLARRFALVGFLISTLFFAFWLLDDKFNFFHLPTADNPPPGNYTQPAVRAFLEKLNFVFCPPLVVTVFGMDMGATAHLILWAISLVLNVVLYFIIGLIVAALWNELKYRRKKPEP